MNETRTPPPTATEPVVAGDLAYCTDETLRAGIDRERIYGRAFGPVAESYRAELARRTCEPS